MVSLPSWISFFHTQLKKCSGCGTVRETPANVAAGQRATTPACGVPFTTGLPPEIANGPYLPSAARLGLPGKQADRAAMPAGVGVRRLEENWFCWVTISWSKPPKKNTLFLIHGPPTVKPPNSSLPRGSCFRQLSAQICLFFWTLFSEFRIELFSVA